jgi:hypothetical protein
MLIKGSSQEPWGFHASFYFSPSFDMLAVRNVPSAFCYGQGGETYDFSDRQTQL